MKPATLSQALGRLITETSPASIPPAVVERARVSLLHNLCVGLLGRDRENVAYRMAEQLWPQPAEASRPSRRWLSPAIGSWRRSR